MKSLKQLKWWIAGIAILLFLAGGFQPREDSLLVTIAGWVVVAILGIAILIIIGFGVKKALETKKNGDTKEEGLSKDEKPTAKTDSKKDEKKSDKKDEGHSLGDIIRWAIGSIILLWLAYYSFEKFGWLDGNVIKEHWILTILMFLTLVYFIAGGFQRGMVLVTGIVIFLGVAYIAYLVSGGGNHQVANTAKGPIPAIVIPEVRTDEYGFITIDVPHDGAWHAIVTPAGKRIGTFKCPADALMQVSGPNVPDPGNIATTDCDAGEQKRNLNIPEQAFWGAAVRFKAKFEDTKVRVKFVNK